MFYKFMWLPSPEPLITELRSEKVDQSTMALVSKLNEKIDLEDWRDRYSKEYNEYLEGQRNGIYELESGLNQELLQAIQSLNEGMVGKKLLYWFDVDRDENEEFVWVNCPISDSKLDDLGDTYPIKNRLLSVNQSLVFPL